MAYTKEQIADYARQLGAKGASPDEIEAFVASASKQVTEQPKADSIGDKLKRAMGAAYLGLYPETRDAMTAGLVRANALPATVLSGGAAAPFVAMGAEALAQAVEGKMRPGAIAAEGIGNALTMGAGGPIRKAVTMGLQNMGAAATEQAVDEGKLDTMRLALAGATGAAGSQVGRLPGTSDTVRVLPKGWTGTERDNVVAGMQKGLKIAPVEVRDTFLERRMMGAAGPSDVRAVLRRDNQMVANDLVKDDINIPRSADITDTAIKGEITRASQPMGEIAAVGPVFEDQLNTVRKLRAEESLIRQQRKSDYRSVTKEEVDAAALAAEAAENQLTLMLNQVDPTLARRYEQARREVSRANVAKDALNPSSAKIDTGDLADRVQGRAPLDGNMGVLGRFANSDVGSQYLGQRTTVPPGTQALRTGMAVTNVSPDNAGQVATNGGYLLINDALREYLTGDKKQRQILQDLLGREMLNYRGDLLRRSLMAAGRNDQQE